PGTAAPAPSGGGGGGGGGLRRSRSTGNIVTVSEPVAASAAAHAPQALRATVPVPVLDVTVLWQRHDAAVRCCPRLPAPPPSRRVPVGRLPDARPECVAAARGRVPGARLLPRGRHWPGPLPLRPQFGGPC